MDNRAAKYPQLNDSVVCSSSTKRWLMRTIQQYHLKYSQALLEKVQKHSDFEFLYIRHICVQAYSNALSSVGYFIHRCLSWLKLFLLKNLCTSYLTLKALKLTIGLRQSPEDIKEKGLYFNWQNSRLRTSRSQFKSTQP